MTKSTFIETVKNTKESLRGNTLTVFGNDQKMQFNTLKSFGGYITSIIKEDSVCYIDGNEFFIYKPVNMLSAIREFGTSA